MNFIFLIRSGMAERTDESMMLRADEILKQAKGYVIFTVDQEGCLWAVANTVYLNLAEHAGLDAFRKKDIENIGEEQEY
jgi:hypothetical protein